VHWQVYIVARWLNAIVEAYLNYSPASRPLWDGRPRELGAGQRKANTIGLLTFPAPERKKRVIGGSGKLQSKV
jgi:hypothetical protein